MHELDTDLAQDAAVIRVDTRLTMVNAPDLRAAVAEALDAGRTTVIVDLGRCEFMDSSGLGAIIGGLKVARQAGGDLRIAAVQPQVKMVLQLTSMDKVLTSYGSAEEAFSND